MITLLNNSLKLLTFRTTLQKQHRSYAVQSKKATTQDKRYSLIQQILYSDDKRAIFTPTQDQQSQHTLIEQMWCLEKEREQDEMDMLLAKQYESIRMAMSTLEKMDNRLFIGACVIYKEGDKIDSFPLKLRVPTDTLPGNKE